MSGLAFRITEPGKEPREVPITTGLQIGRADDNTIVLKDPQVSGRHAHVVETPEGFAIEDLGSSNHTQVVGGPTLGQAERHNLNQGVALEIGETKLVVVGDAAAGGIDKTVAAHVVNVEGEGANMSALAQLAAFKTAKPRLVICNEAIKKIVEIDKANFAIGRAGEAVNCEIEHPAVSSNHARVVFDNKRFYLEDLGSRNGTSVNGEALSSNGRAELSPESHVRFGSVDALFAVDSDAEGRKGDAQQIRKAVELLTREGTITRLQREKAESEVRSDREAGVERHAGERLLVNGFLKVEQWTQALKRADMVDLGPAASGGGGRGLLLVMGVVVLLLIAVIAVLVVNPGILGLG